MLLFALEFVNIIGVFLNSIGFELVVSDFFPSQLVFAAGLATFYYYNFYIFYILICWGVFSISIKLLLIFEFVNFFSVGCIGRGRDVFGWFFVKAV